MIAIRLNRDMNERVKNIFAELHDLPDFPETDFSDVNACCTDGDNALHYVVSWGDLSPARDLIEAGIDVNKAGDLGYTPLHRDCMAGNVEIVKLLLENGADLFAMSEGDTPFSAARLASDDDIWDLLGPLMEEVSSQDPKVWVRARIAQLNREIERLEKQL